MTGEADVAGADVAGADVAGAAVSSSACWSKSAMAAARSNPMRFFADFFFTTLFLCTTTGFLVDLLADISENKFPSEAGVLGFDDDGLDKDENKSPLSAAEGPVSSDGVMNPKPVTPLGGAGESVLPMKSNPPAVVGSDGTAAGKVVAVVAPSIKPNPVSTGASGAAIDVSGLAMKLKPPELVGSGVNVAGAVEVAVAPLIKSKPVAGGKFSAAGCSPSAGLGLNETASKSVPSPAVGGSGFLSGGFPPRTFKLPNKPPSFAGVGAGALVAAFSTVDLKLPPAAGKLKKPPLCGS